MSFHRGINFISHNKQMDKLINKVIGKGNHDSQKVSAKEINNTLNCYFQKEKKIKMSNFFWAVTNFAEELSCVRIRQTKQVCPCDFHF